MAIGHVQIRRGRQSEPSLQEDLPRRGGEEVGAANNRGSPPGARRRRRPRAGRRRAHPPAGRRNRRRRAPRSWLCGPWSRSRNSMRASLDPHARGSLAPLAMRCRNCVAAGPRIHALAARADGGRFELAPRARAVVDVGARAQTIEGRRIELGAFRLPDDGTIPGESVALERSEDRGVGAALRARQIDVLDADQPLPAGGPCIAIARDRRDERAEVQRSGGRGCVAAAVGRRERIGGARSPRRIGGRDDSAGSALPPGAYSQFRFMAASTAFG